MTWQGLRTLSLAPLSASHLNMPAPFSTWSHHDKLSWTEVQTNGAVAAASSWTWTSELWEKQTLSRDKGISALSLQWQKWHQQPSLTSVFLSVTSPVGKPGMVWFQGLWDTLLLQMGMWLTIQTFLARRNHDRYLHSFPAHHHTLTLNTCMVGYLYTSLRRINHPTV